MDLLMDCLKGEEKTTFALRSLFERLGYKKVRVRRFEEYGLYLDNKNFLGNESMITFTGMDGKLLALRPDVTLSIVKNLDCGRSATFEKLYYLEKVYRLSRQSHEYKEISQMGLECIGDIDNYSMIEVLSLAANSLCAISDSFVLDVAHMGFLSGLLEPLSTADATEAARFIRAKNRHELKLLLDRTVLPQGHKQKLLRVTELYGGFAEVLREARPLVTGAMMQTALDELSAIHSAFEGTPLAPHLSLDFSVVNDLDYYNGVIFQGYIETVPKAVLAGGRYDNLLHKFGKDKGAIGFAVYLDELEHYYRRDTQTDADVLVLYDHIDDYGLFLRQLNELTAQGHKVRVEREAPCGFRCEDVLRYRDGVMTKEGGAHA